MDVTHIAPHAAGVKGERPDAAKIAHALGGVRRGRGWRARCPAHNDRNPSLDIDDGATGPVVICRAGCSQDAVIEALRDMGLWPGGGPSRPRAAARAPADPPPAAVISQPQPPGEPSAANFADKAGRTPSRVWHYYDAAGRYHHARARYERQDGGKDVMPWHWDGAQWQNRAPGGMLPLYGVTQLMARPAAPVVVTEGEKAADAAARLFPDHAVTTSAGGSKAAAKSDWSPLMGRAVIIWPDNDAPGRAYAEDVARRAHAAGAASIRVLSLDWLAGWAGHPLPAGYDAADALADGLTSEILVEAFRQHDAAVAAVAAHDAPCPEPLPQEIEAARAFGAGFVALKKGRRADAEPGLFVADAIAKLVVLRRADPAAYAAVETAVRKDTRKRLADAIARHDDDTRRGWEAAREPLLAAVNASIAKRWQDPGLTLDAGGNADGPELGAPAPSPSRGEPEAIGERTYEETRLGLVWNKRTHEGIVPVRLANFTARIVSEAIEDDGLETRAVYGIEANVRGRTVTIDVPADAFAGMGWVSRLGHDAIVAAGVAAKDRAREAIQTITEDAGGAAVRRVYTHSGWREIDGRMVYLHAGGAVGAGGAVSGISVGLNDTLQDLVLIEPETSDVLRQAVADAIATLDVGPLLVTAPVIGTSVIAPIVPTDFTVHVAGLTGILKSELAGIAQSFFGPAWHGRHLPGSWLSTAVGLEMDLHRAKDAAFVVDDFKPSERPPQDAARLHKHFDDVVRSKGNGTGRARGRTDGTKRPPRPPRAAILSTGEDLPKGHSCLARTLVVDVVRGDIDPARLTTAQARARAGIYSRATWGFVQWLADGNRERAQEVIRAEIEAARAGHDGKRHLRTNDIAAAIVGAWRVFLAFAVEVGAATEAEAAEKLSAIEAALAALADAQAEMLKNEDPLTKFFGFLRGLLASGGAHVATPEGAVPDNAGAWGWRGSVSGWQPQGERIGWIDGPDVFLEPAAAYKAIQSFARASNDGVSYSEQTLWKRLHERGLLASTETTGGKRRLKVRRMLEGTRKNVIHISHSLLCAAESAPSAPESGNIVAFHSVSVAHSAEKSAPPVCQDVGKVRHDELAALAAGDAAGAAVPKSAPRGTLVAHLKTSSVPQQHVDITDGNAPMAHLAHFPPTHTPIGKSQLENFARDFRGEVVGHHNEDGHEEVTI